MPDRATRARHVRELERRCYVALSVSELREEVLRRLRTIMTIDAAFVARISRLERGAAPPAPVLLAHDRPILAGFALGEGPEFMKLANSLPTAACHPKASRGKRVQRNLGLAASDTSAKIGAACYQRF